MLDESPNAMKFIHLPIDPYAESASMSSIFSIAELCKDAILKYRVTFSLVHSSTAAYAWKYPTRELVKIVVGLKPHQEMVKNGEGW